MKKKEPAGSPSMKVKERLHPYFCDAAGDEKAVLGGIALRVLMSDIRKHKLSGENESEKSARGFEMGAAPEDE